MRCEEARSRIEEARLGLLAPGEAEALRVQLGACPECVREAREARAFERLLDLARDPDRDARLQHALETARARRTRRGRLLAAGAAAAAALLGLALLSFLRSGPARLEPGAVAVLRRGETRALPGAVVRGLSGNTRLRAEAGGRRVILLAGAARFRVEPGRGPFSVVTPAGEVEVEGTVFVVRVMRRAAWITGGVVTAVLVTTGAVLLHHPEGDVRVAPGELVVATPDGPPRRLDARDVARLLSELETAKHDRDLLRRKNEKLARELARLREEKGPGAPAGAGAAKSKPPPGEKKPNLPASVRDTDWEKLGTAVAKLVEASAEGKDPASDLGLMLRMAYLQGRLKAIARELGLADENEVFYHPLVTERFLGGLAKALYPELDGERRESLVRHLTTVVRDETRRWAADPLPIEKRLRDLDLALRLGERARGELDDEQVARLLRVVASDRPGRHAVHWSMTADVESLRLVLGGDVVSRYGLSGPEAETARDLAAAFVDRHLAVRAELVREFGQGIVDAAFGLEGGAAGGPPPERTDRRQGSRFPRRTPGSA